jgi:hypothetical protein
VYSSGGTYDSGYDGRQWVHTVKGGRDGGWGIVKSSERSGS